MLNTKNDKTTQKHEGGDIWEEIAQDSLVGKKIVEVRYMTEKEKDSWGWYGRPVCILLDDGTWITPMKDDEGNDGGAIAITAVKEENDTVLPVQ